MSEPVRPRRRRADRDWVARSFLALVALASFLGGFTAGGWRLAAGVFVAAGTTTAILVDWLALRARRRNTRDVGNKLREISALINHDATREVLHSLSRQVFVGEAGWRVSLYRLDGATWTRLARAASHEMYETSGRASFADDNSFMIRFRSRSLTTGSVIVESPITMPDRNISPTDWHIMQAEEGRLEHAVASTLLMPTRVYVFAAFRSGSSPYGTLALCLEALDEAGVDEIAAKRELRPALFESLARLVAVTEVITEAPHIYTGAVQALEGK